MKNDFEKKKNENDFLVIEILFFVNDFWRHRNFEFFDAPYIAFLGMNPSFGTTVALDVGMYAQSLMLSMVAFGLHSCPMGTMRNYPDLVRESFDIQDDTKILFGISFGYEDKSVPANKTITSRDDIATNVVFRSD